MYITQGRKLSTLARHSKYLYYINHQCTQCISFPFFRGFLTDTELLTGTIVNIEPTEGLTVSTSMGDRTCRIPLSEISEDGEDVSMSDFSVGQTVMCKVARTESGCQTLLTMRHKAWVFHFILYSYIEMAEWLLSCFERNKKNHCHSKSHAISQ